LRSVLFTDDTIFILWHAACFQLLDGIDVRNGWMCFVNVAGMLAMWCCRQCMNGGDQLASQRERWKPAARVPIHAIAHGCRNGKDFLNTLSIEQNFRCIPSKALKFVRRFAGVLEKCCVEVRQSCYRSEIFDPPTSGLTPQSIRPQIVRIKFESDIHCSPSHLTIILHLYPNGFANIG
jgi:hypothetical protein